MPLAPRSPLSHVSIRPARTALAAALLSLGAAAALLPGRAAEAFEGLNEAQSLVYDRAHLASLAAGDELRYRYRASGDGDVAIEDDARLQVDGVSDPERRDVTLEFLSGERHLALPAFEGYRGNPVLIAMLEHVAQSMSAETGGGALYFRNRIRDALADERARVETAHATFDERTIETTTLEFEPFRDDAYLGARPHYGGARFRIVLSDDVPGGVVSIEARSDDTSSAPGAFGYELRLAADS